MKYKALNFEIVNNPKAPKMDDTEKEFMGNFDDIWGEAKAAKEPIKKMMEQSYLSYRSILSDYSVFSAREVERYGMAIFVPITFQVVASIQAQLNGRPPMYRIGPANSPKDRQEADYISHLSKAEFRRAKAMREIAGGVQNSLIFGTSFLRSYLRYDVRKRKFIKDVDPETKQVTSYEERDHTFYKGWSLDNIHPLKVYLPPQHEHDPQAWNYYIERDLCDVRVEAAYYKAHPELCYGNNWQALVPGGDLTDDMEVYFKLDPLYRLSDQRYPGSMKDVLNPIHSVQMSQMNNKYLAEKFRVFIPELDAWAVIIGGRLIEFHPNPLEDSKALPVVAMRDYKVEKSPWGIGEPQLIRYLQMEANALHTFGMDGTKFATNGVFAINSMYLKRPADMSVYPGKIFELKNLPNMDITKVIQSFNSPDVKSSVFRMLGMNQQLISSTVGAGSSVIGGDPVNSQGSATDSNNMKAASTTRIYERARAIEQENLVDIVGHQLSHIALYDEEMTVKITDDEFYRYVPGSESELPEFRKHELKNAGYKAIIYGDDIAKGYDTVIEGESTLPISRQERRVEALQILKMAAETRRPPTAEELQKDPQLLQKFPQGVPIMDANAVAERIVLPTFTVIDNPQEFMWNMDNSVGKDRTRDVGRPPDVISPDGNIPESMQHSEAATLMSNAQPANEGVNPMEQMI